MARLAQDFPYFTAAQIDQAVRVIFEEMTAALERDDRVELRKFGTFSVRHRRARLGRNPQSGAAVEVDAKAVPFFKASALLVERMSADIEATDRQSDGKETPPR
jgi:integration host factor subunit beta